MEISYECSKSPPKGLRSRFSGFHRLPYLAQYGRSWNPSMNSMDEMGQNSHILIGLLMSAFSFVTLCVIIGHKALWRIASTLVAGT
jgi:hypothetical protein